MEESVTRRLEIGLQESTDGRWVHVSVSDTGPGIDREDLEHVFERLYVSQRYRPVRPEGSGLGLSIVKELVDAMGGFVDVASVLGEGTTVTVRIAADGGSSHQGR